MRAMVVYAARLLRTGIAAVVNLAAEEPSPALPRVMIYCRLPIMDGEQDDGSVLDLAIQTVVSLLRKQIPTLVHCSAGMSLCAGRCSGCAVDRARRQPGREVERDRSQPAARRFAAIVGGGS